MFETPAIPGGWAQVPSARRKSAVPPPEAGTIPASSVSNTLRATLTSFSGVSVRSKPTAKSKVVMSVSSGVPAAATVIPDPPPPPGGVAQVPSARRNSVVPPADVGTAPGVDPANAVIANVRLAARLPPPVSGAVGVNVVAVSALRSRAAC